MSESQRYTSRTAGRVERRQAPAPYTPTKPAPKPKKKPSTIWDFIKTWSFFGSSTDTDNEDPEPTPEPCPPTEAPPSLQDIIARHRTASPKSNETQEAIVALQAKAPKNLYERGLELQREHEMMQEMAPPSTSPSEPIEEEKPAPKVYHMPFYHRPGTKEWFVANITKHSGKTPNLVVANYLLAKGTEPLDDIEWSAIREVLADIKPPKKATPPPVPRSNRQPTGLEILARIQPQETEIPVFIDEWITKPAWGYCPSGDDFWDGNIYGSRPRDIPQGMEYRTFSGGSGYLARKRPGGLWNTGPPPHPTANTSKRPRLEDGGFSASTGAPTSLGLPTKSTDPELFIPHASTSKPPPPPLISTGKTRPLAGSQKNDETTKKEAPLKKSQTYKTMQEIVIEEAAKKAAEEKERRRKELIEKAMIALDGGAGRPPIRKDRPILRYDSQMRPFFKKQPKKEQAKKVPTVNDILDIHTGRADPSQFDAPTADTPAGVPRPPAMKPYDPTPRKRSPKRSLDEHQQEHGEIETAETSPKKKVKTNGIMLATHVQVTSGSGAAAEDAIVIDDLDEEMNDTSTLAPAATIPVLTPAPAPAPAPVQTSSMPPPSSKPRAIPALAPVNPLAPPFSRAFSPSRPSPLRMVSSVDSPEGSPHPTPFSIFNAKPKPEPEVIDVDAEEEDQLAEDENENAPTPASTSIAVAPAPVPVFKPTPAPAPVAQPKPQPTVNSWSIPKPNVTQPVVVSPISPKSTARNAPVDSLRDFSKTLSGTSLCYDVVMGDPEARTIARAAPQDELPAFVIDLSPMFDPTPWIERKNTAPPVRSAPTSTQAVAPVKQTLTTRSWAAAGPKLDAPTTSTFTTPAPAPKPAPVSAPVPAPPAAPAPVKAIPFDWAAAGWKPSTPAAGEWTCTVCNCKTKDTLQKCSVCEAPKPGAAASTPTSAPTPTSPTMPALIPTPTPVKAPSAGFNWDAAGLKLPTKPLGTWTCSVCTIDNKPEADNCIACDASGPTSGPTSIPLTNGFKLPPPIRNNGFSWGIPPTSIVASQPAIN